MALITCPECGNQISDTTKACVHCGCNISVCPECHEIYVGNITECKNCGFKFVEEKESKPTIKENCIDLYNKWKSDNILHQITDSASWLCVILMLLAYTFFIVGFFKLQNWANALSGGDKMEDIFSGVNALTNTSAIKSDVNTLWVFGSIFLIVAFLLLNILPLFKSNLLRRWFSDNRIDLVSSMNDYLLASNFSWKTKQSLLKEKKVVWSLVDADIYNDVLHQEKERNNLILECILIVISLLFLSIFLLGNLETYMQNIFLYGKISIDYIENWWTLIVGFLLLFVFCILNTNRLKNFPKKRKDFIRKNMPDAYNNFSNYFGN